MNLNPLTVLYRWANKQAAAEAAEARRQRNIANREAARAKRDAKRDARRVVEEEGNVVVPKEDYQELVSKAKRAGGLETENQQLQRRPTTAEYEDLKRRAGALEKDASLVPGLREKVSKLTTEKEQQLCEKTSAMNVLKQRAEAAEQDAKRIDGEKKQLESAYGALQRQLEQMVSRTELENAQAQTREKETSVERLQSELFESEQRVMDIARQIAEQRKHIIRTASSSIYPPISGSTIAVVSQNPECIMASAQLVRLNVPVVYTFEENFHNAIASIRKADEVIVVGPKLTDDAVKRLRSLYRRGCKITLVGDYNLEFATVYSNGSVHISLHDYVNQKRKNDTIMGALAFLPEQEDAQYIKDSIALNPADVSYRDGVISQLAHEGTLKGSRLDEGALIKSRVYGFLQSRNLL